MQLLLPECLKSLTWHRFSVQMRFSSVVVMDLLEIAKHFHLKEVYRANSLLWQHMLQFHMKVTLSTVIASLIFIFKLAIQKITPRPDQPSFYHSNHYCYLCHNLQNTLWGFPGDVYTTINQVKSKFLLWLVLSSTMMDDPRNISSHLYIYTVKRLGFVLNIEYHIQ